MSRLTLRYNKNSEHFIVPHGKPFPPRNGSPTEYIGTVVFRKSGSSVNAGMLDVYYIKKWQRSGIKQLSDGREYFTNALNSPDNFEPIFDCDTIKVFAEEGYYFVDEKTGQKSLRYFNVRWWVDSKPKPVIENYYRGCEHFNSRGANIDVEYENGIPNVPLERF